MTGYAGYDWICGYGVRICGYAGYEKMVGSPTFLSTRLTGYENRASSFPDPSIPDMKIGRPKTTISRKPDMNENRDKPYGWRSCPLSRFQPNLHAEWK